MRQAITSNPVAAKFTASKEDKRRGTALVLAALFCLVLVPVIGLAVDGTDVYLMKSELNTALEAGVLSGARSLNVGLTITEQGASAGNVALTVFNADFSGIPSLNPLPPANCASTTCCASSSNVSVCFTVSENDTTHYRMVSGVYTASLPVFLLGLIHVANVPVTATISATRRDVNIVLVLDHSGGMNSVSSIGTNPLAELQTDATTFVKLFANGRDNIGVVTFTGAPYPAAPLPNKNFLATDGSGVNVPAAIGTLTSSQATNSTNTAAAMWMAYQQLVALNEPGALNVIVLFTDGIPGAFTAAIQPGNLKGSQNICTSTSPVGVVYATPNQNYDGVLSDLTSTGINDTPDIRSAPTCNQFQASPTSLLTTLPDFDANNNSIDGKGTVSPAYTTLYNTFGYYTFGSLTDPSDVTAITGASVNALDDAANRIRSDTTLKPLIFAIGLAGNSANLTLPPDDILMSRIANDPNSQYYSAYNSQQPLGQYVKAPTTAQLQAAFTSIASQVLKLASN